MKASLPGFAEFVWLWYRQQDQTIPRLHLRMARWLEAAWRSGEKGLLLMAFRSAGKSTIVGLFCAWLLGRAPDLRILVLAADQALAVKMVRNVKRIVERHGFLPALRPRGADQWAADRFTVERGLELRDPSMLARGIAGNITGSRADVVICDDVEVPNTAGTPAKRADLRARLAEIDYVLVPGGLQLFIGTPHARESIYFEDGEDHDAAPSPVAGFGRLVIPIHDATGRPAWPGRFPAEAIAALRRRTGPARFASQMLLQPQALAEARLDPARLVRYAAELDYREGNRMAELRLLGRRLVAAACWWDPAFGAPEKGDASVIAAVFFDAEGRSYIHRVAYLTHDPARLAQEDEASQLCRQAAAFVKSLHLPSVKVEINGLGRFLPGLLRRALAEAGTAAAVVEQSSRLPKVRRILEAFDAPLAGGVLHAHESLWRTPFIDELRDWQPTAAAAGGRQRDDGLDAVAGCLAGEPVRLPRLASPPTNKRWQGAGGQYEAEAVFEP